MKNIKMIAVDMDGTFLKSDMSYNKERFMKQYDTMKEKGIEFVVASGNQYYQLISFFPEIKNEISFVAENGAFVVHKGHKIFNGEMSKDLVHQVMDVLNHYDGVSYIICGVEAAYIPNTVNEAFFDNVNKYYHRLERVESMYDVQDTIFKFALLMDGSIQATVEKELNDKVGHIITAVTSGHQAIDLIIPGVHKASGLMKLQAILDIDANEIASFGDSNNDLEMLKHSGHGYAMLNGKDTVKAVSTSIVDSNDDEGVLNQIEIILNY